jgi:glyoxylase-like metal-dependent hydrolase (beta-lactamase superfamily II)
MTLGGTNTYLVGSDPAYLIDPGPEDASHLAAVGEAAAGRGGIAGILLTHSDADHAEAVPALAAPLLEGREQAGPFEIIPTPGHSRDHVAFVYGDVCFCGDVVLGEGSTIVPPGGGGLVAYLDSLDRLRARGFDLLCPGHGPWITDPPAKLDEYRAHRLERERKLLAALERGERSRERLLDAAWDDVPAPLRPVAALAMEAHLDKLESEGRLPGDLAA